MCLDYHDHMRLTTSLLAVGAAARLARLVITDDLGQWWVQQPVARAMGTYATTEMVRAAEEDREPVEPWWWKYESGLQCPWCIGFWLGTGVLVTGAVADRHPTTRALWKLGAGALALNYVTAHLGARLGDFEDDDEESDDHDER